MPESQSSVDAAIQSVVQLRKTLGRNKTQRQVQSQQERALVKAIGFAWFKSARPSILATHQGLSLSQADQHFTDLTENAERKASREQYLALLQTLKAELVRLRSEMLRTEPSDDSPDNYPPPDFSPLIPDAAMQRILARRWRETRICMAGGADLAATVMMGGLLEGLFLARINAMPDQGPAFKAKTSPKEKTGNTKPLKDWGLQNYIEVAHELKWIRQTAKDVGEVLRDYRNYIHPQKELSHGLSLDSSDTTMFWSVFSTLAQQIIKS